MPIYDPTAHTVHPSSKLAKQRRKRAAGYKPRKKEKLGAPALPKPVNLSPESVAYLTEALKTASAAAAAAAKKT